MIWMIAGAILIGVTLGLMGSGGSILTVPVLVYVLGHDKDLAVAESMAIVGLIALVAAIPSVVGKYVDWKSVLFFGLPGMLGTFIGAWIGANFFSGAAKLVFFSLVMLLAAWSMFRKREAGESEAGESEAGESEAGESTGAEAGESTHQPPVRKIAGEGMVVGIVTGIVGVGGGFLIVPALVLLGGLSMRLAVGTSLVIIMLKCLVGFSEYQYEFWQEGISVDWQTIVIFAILGSTGSFVGRYIGQVVKQATLRKTFAVLLVIMAVLILAREAPAVFQSTDKEPPAVASDTSRTDQNLLTGEKHDGHQANPLALIQRFHEQA